MLDTDIPRYTKTSFWQKIALVLSGIFLTLILIEAVLSLGEFIFISLQESRNKASLMQKGTYRILCLGESTTQGQYPAFLEEALNRRNDGIKFSVIDKGQGGTKTWVIVSNLESYLDVYHPDAVITIMGVNDMGSHMPYETVSASKVRKLLKSLKIYKLTRILWWNIETRLKERKAYKFSKHVDIKENNIPLSEVELKLKQAIALNPSNSGVFVKWGTFYQDHGKFSEAEELFKKAIALNPSNDETYVKLGVCYQKQGKFSEAKESYKKAIMLNLHNGGAYVNLGIFYQGQGMFSEAEELFKKAIALNPGDGWAYTRLGILYQKHGKFSEAEELFKKAIALNSEDSWAYVDLGISYQDQGRFSEAEELFKRFMIFDPSNGWPYEKLGTCYQNHGKFSEAEELFKKAIAFNPGDARVYGLLEVLYIEMGNQEFDKKYNKKVKESGLGYYFPITIVNYNKLKTILDKRGITYICVQYPMRAIGPLKKIFQGNDKGIIFVDNEKIFRDAVAKDGYQKYFIDMFAGDFGHCTKKGNRLLAEHIANVILQEVSHK